MYMGLPNQNRFLIRIIGHACVSDVQNIKGVGDIFIYYHVVYMCVCVYNRQAYL